VTVTHVTVRLTLPKAKVLLRQHLLTRTFCSDYQSGGRCRRRDTTTAAGVPRASRSGREAAVQKNS
jgi:hypothetical protein